MILPDGSVGDDMSRFADIDHPDFWTNSRWNPNIQPMSTVWTYAAVHYPDASGKVEVRIGFLPNRNASQAQELLNDWGIYLVFMVGSPAEFKSFVSYMSMDAQETPYQIVMSFIYQGIPLVVCAVDETSMWNFLQNPEEFYAEYEKMSV